MDMVNQIKAKEIADSRLVLISPLLNEGLDHAELVSMRRKISEESGKSEKSLMRYLRNYQARGYDGLKPQGRQHKIANRKIPEEVLQEAIILRREVPSRSVRTIIMILEESGRAERGLLKRSTLQDALDKAGFSAAHLKIYREAGYNSQRFQQVHRNDLWQGDIKVGPVLRIKGKNVRTYFSCIIDDATRCIMHGEFYASMEQVIVEDTLRKALTKYGLPKSIYFDNGKQYRNRWMARTCKLLGIKLKYAAPYNAKGKGKQERYNRTLDFFFDEIRLDKPTSLEELNRKYKAWESECYLNIEHAGIGETPLNAYNSDSTPLRFVNRDILERAFLHCETRKVDKSGCISFKGEKYDVGIEHAGRKIDIAYDMANLDCVTVEINGKMPFTARKAIIGTHVGPKPQREKLKPIVAKRSRLLEVAEKSSKAKRERKMHAISYSAEMKKE